ncbi:MAG: DUF1223 domain-containing protein, partial [Actinobacteria bacterium]|nr:DUF1223 domain-containing protein [Actinomycetota bacterium]
STTLWLESTADAGPLQIGYKVEGGPAGAELWIALVERSIVRPIGAGENQGRTLTHDSVVRVFDIVADPVEGTIPITPPADVVVEEASLIGFVQDPTSMLPSGATDLHLSED